MRRGGIPICFPQFGGFGPLSQHGFCRNSDFKLIDGGSTSVTLSMHTTKEQLKLFPHPFELRVTVSTHVQHHEDTSYGYGWWGYDTACKGHHVDVHCSPQQGCPEHLKPLARDDQGKAQPSVMQCWLSSWGRTAPEYIL